MQITLTNVTEDQLDELLKVVKDNPALESISWQLRGYWITGAGDEQIPATDSTSLNN